MAVSYRYKYDPLVADLEMEGLERNEIIQWEIAYRVRCDLLMTPAILCLAEMTDKWVEGNGEPVMDGVTFCVKFLGSTLIESVGAADAAEATKTVIQMVSFSSPDFIGHH